MRFFAWEGSSFRRKYLLQKVCCQVYEVRFVENIYCRRFVARVGGSFRQKYLLQEIFSKGRRFVLSKIFTA